MKKIFLFVTLSLLALAMQAQRCVLLDFQVGDNVTAEEVESVSYEFRSNFNPSCCKVEDYFKVARILKQCGYNSSYMKKDQIRSFGRKMTANVVVYGSLGKLMGEYSLDVIVMDVSTGNTLFSKNTTFQKSEYRTKPRSVAKDVSSQLCKSLSGASTGGSGSGSNVVAKPSVPQGYTDLGLPSGKLWKNFNATGFYTYDEAVSQFGSRLPTKADWDELKAECQWSWTGSGYNVTGPNGNSITLPAAGHRNCGSYVWGVGSIGGYWSSTPNGSEYAWSLNFNSGGVNVGDDWRCGGVSVRLVQDK